MNKETVGSSIISAVVSAVVTIVIWRLLERISFSILVVFFIAILLFIFILLNLPKWTKGRKLLLRILPENRMTIPVDGRDLSVVIYNKNKNYDVDVNIKLDFPRFLDVFVIRNYNIYNELELENDISDEKLEKIEESFEKNIKLAAMNEYRITFKLVPIDYGKKGYIRYILNSEFKSIKNKIDVET